MPVQHPKSSEVLLFQAPHYPDSTARVRRGWLRLQVYPGGSQVQRSTNTSDEEIQRRKTRQYFLQPSFKLTEELSLGTVMGAGSSSD